MGRFLEDLDLDGNALTNGTVSSTLIPDLADVIRAVPLDELELPGDDLDLNTKKLVNVKAGVAPTDGVNVSQLGDAIGGAAVDFGAHSLSELDVPTADLDLGAFKAVNLKDGTAPTDGATVGQVTSAVGAVASDLAAKGLNDFAAPDGPVDLGTQEITNLADGMTPTSAVNRRQLDSAQLGIDWKNSVFVVATTNIALTGLQNVDGQDLEEDDLVLCVGQDVGTENLAYHAHAGPWEIAEQFTDGNLSSGAYVPVEVSSTPGVKYRLATPDPIQVGTTDLDWQIADLATTYVGDGETIEVTGGVIKVITTRVSRWVEGILGDGALTQIPITHNLGHKGIISQVWDIASGETVNCGMLRTSDNVMTYRFANAPAAGALGFAIQG